MKVYFTASLTGKAIYGVNYEKIVGSIFRLGHKITEVVMSSEIKQVQKDSTQKHVRVYKKIRKFIEEADVLVAEISYSSIAVGFEVTTALSLNKQVLLLHLPGIHSPLLEGVRDKNLNICEYRVKDIENVVAKCLEKLEKNIDIRFNFFISRGLLARLDSTMGGLGNKSAYIRGLIEGDMKKNKSYHRG